MDIQVYANEAHIEAEGDKMLVTLAGVDMETLIGQLYSKDVLDQLDIGDIFDYVAKESKRVTHEL